MRKNRRNIEIPKDLFKKWEVASNGATVTLGFTLWPDWAKKTRDPETDDILFCSCDDGDRAYPSHNEKLVGRATVMRRDKGKTGKHPHSNKDVLFYYSNPNGNIVQRENPHLRDKRDHYMESTIPEEYKDWPIVDDT